VRTALLLLEKPTSDHAVAQTGNDGAGKSRPVEGRNPGGMIAAGILSLFSDHARSKAGVLKKDGIHGLRHRGASHLHHKEFLLCPMLINISL
jgi:hypothetical protein